MGADASQQIPAAIKLQRATRQRLRSRSRALRFFTQTTRSFPLRISNTTKLGNESILVLIVTLALVARLLYSLPLLDTIEVTKVLSAIKICGTWHGAGCIRRTIQVPFPTLPLPSSLDHLANGCDKKGMPRRTRALLYLPSSPTSSQPVMLLGAGTPLSAAEAFSARQLALRPIPSSSSIDRTIVHSEIARYHLWYLLAPLAVGLALLYFFIAVMIPLSGQRLRETVQLLLNHRRRVADRLSPKATAPTSATTCTRPRDRKAIVGAKPGVQSSTESAIASGSAAVSSSGAPTAAAAAAALISWNELQRRAGGKRFTNQQMSLLWEAHKAHTRGTLTYNQFRSHCKGHRLSREAVSAMWAQHKHMTKPKMAT